LLAALIQDAGMQWLYVLLALVPFLVGAVGSDISFEPQQPDVATSSLVDSSRPEVDPDTASVEVLAGKSRPGARFTKKDKAVVKQDNASRNEGKNRCENCGVETVQPQQHKKGITPPKNETHVDHIVPRAKGGEGEPDNGQVLCRECNIKKGDKEQ
jgi:5-methylcytosine-specific restriction endonuclease McrA